MTPIEQFTIDLNDWLERRGDNIVTSRKLIEHCKPHMRQYWRDWLAVMRRDDGLPIYVTPTSPDAA